MQGGILECRPWSIAAEEDELYEEEEEVWAVRIVEDYDTMKEFECLPSFSLFCPIIYKNYRDIFGNC